jgi:putative peptide zinc metalloprotease protein
LDERQLESLAVGHTARFWSQSLSGPVLHATVVSIDRDATRELPRPELAAPLGGHIQARSADGKWLPEQAVYHVVLAPSSPSAIAADTRTWRGELLIDGQWQSPAIRYLKNAVAVMWRELDF